MLAVPSVPRTLYDKVWDDHVIEQRADGLALIYIDGHLIHEVTSPQAFDGLTTARKNTSNLVAFIEEPESRAQVLMLEENVKDFAIPYFGRGDRCQDIVHVIGPEQGFTLPGITCVCAHGAFGSLAFGIGTSEVEHVLATQTLLQKKAKNMRIFVDSTLPEVITSKDVILHIISIIGTAGGTGCVIEYAGSVFRGFSMEARMSVCNISVEVGARAGMVAPDDITFEYLRNRPLAPKGDAWDRAVAYWRSLKSDVDAEFDIEVSVRAEDIVPLVTWGTSPQDVVPITGTVPDPNSFANPARRSAAERALQYMDLAPGTRMQDIKLNKVFIGSCTNSRIEDLRSAAKVVIAAGPRATVAEGVHALIVPGSGLMKQHAEAEGLDVLFKRAGFDWREAGCSLCVGSNSDELAPGQRCASTSNRNFEGRQGPGRRAHLLSPAMAVAAALRGSLADVREFVLDKSQGHAEMKTVDAPILPLGSITTASESGTIVASEASVSADVSFSASTSSMEKFTIVEGIAAAIYIQNVDTDTIIPKQFCKTLKRTGLSGGLFHSLRVDPFTGKSTDFVLNREPYTMARILVCMGENFGCGSSREHAAWALKDFGIRAVIAPSFADIHRNNLMQNGMLPVDISQSDCVLVAADAETGLRITIDLEKEEIRRSYGQPAIPFRIDPFRRHCLLNVLDDIALTLQKLDKIDEFEQRRSERWPWLDGFGYTDRKIPIVLQKVKNLDW